MQKHTVTILIATILLLGVGWPISKIGLHDMQPITFAACRLVIATVFTFLIVIITRNFVWPRRSDWPIILAVGIFQIAIFVALLHMGLNLVEVGRSTILVYTTPLWVTPVAVFLFKEPAGLLKWLGLLLGMLGIVVLFGPWGIDWSDSKAVQGNVFLLLAALSWAISILCVRYIKWERSALAILPWQLLVGTVLVLCLIPFEYSAAAINWNSQIIIILLFSGIMTQAAGTLGLVMVSKALPAVTTSLSLLAVPVTSLICSHLLLGEAITVIKVLAMAFILLGLLCTTLDQKYAIYKQKF